MPARCLIPAHQLARRAALARQLATRRPTPDRPRSLGVALFEAVGVAALLGGFMAVAILA